MKSFSFLKMSASLVAFAALLGAASVQAANPAVGFEPGQAKIVDFKGNVQFIHNGKAMPMQKGDILNEKDTIITTGIGSEVKLDLGANGGELNIIEDTTVVLETLQVKKTPADTISETTLDLKKGGLIGNVKKVSAASRYDVKHAQGVAGIRGTIWAILPGKGVICSEGSVFVTFIVNGVTTSLTLQAGQMVVPPAPGQPPIVIDIPPAVADFLVGIFGGDRPPGPGPGPHGRDIVVIVSANAGTDSGSNTPNHQPQ